MILGLDDTVGGTALSWDVTDGVELVFSRFTRSRSRRGIGRPLLEIWDKHTGQRVLPCRFP